MKRNELAEHLRKRSIGVAVHYPMPIYAQPLCKDLGCGRTVYPIAEDASRQVTSLPVHPSVTEEDITYILNVLKEIS